MVLISKKMLVYRILGLYLLDDYFVLVGFSYQVRYCGFTSKNIVLQDMTSDSQGKYWSNDSHIPVVALILYQILTAVRVHFVVFSSELLTYPSM